MAQSIGNRTKPHSGIHYSVTSEDTEIDFLPYLNFSLSPLSSDANKLFWGFGSLWLILLDRVMCHVTLLLSAHAVICGQEKIKTILRLSDLLLDTRPQLVAGTLATQMQYVVLVSVRSG